jgi:putative endonuclease
MTHFGWSAKFRNDISEGKRTEFRDDAYVEKESSMRKAKRFHVYIMTNRPRSHVLYTGVTGKLPHRVFQHNNKLVPGFTGRYNLTRVVYYDCSVYPDAAIAREKEIKGWRRSKKIRLIESMNPHWDDLAEEWTDVYKPGVDRAGVRHSTQDPSVG